MAVSQLPQAPYRQDRRIYPTPIIGDVLFSEVRDCTRSEIPEYGTPHPNPKKWPDHKLVFVKPVDIERDGIFEFFYAAERENQDLYNFSSGYRNVVGNAGGREFRVVQRSYVTLRDKFQPMDIEFAAPMMNVPEGKFDDVEYVFFDRQQQPIQEQELNALFVAEVHTYIEKAFLDDKLSYTVQRTDPLPEKFQILVPEQVTEELVEGSVELPTLTGSQLSVKEDQINPDIKLVRTATRNRSTLPVSLGQKATTNVKQLADITETVQSGDTTDLPSSTVDIESQALGDGTYFVRKTEVPELFAAESYSIQKPDPVPEKFRVLVPTESTEETVEGTAGMPTLEAGEFAASEQQLTVFTKRKSSTQRDLTTLPKSIFQKITTNEKLVATVTDTLQIGDTTESPTALKDIQSDALGDGTYVVRKTEIPKIFEAKSFAAQKSDTVPERFRAEVETTTEQKNKLGQASKPNLSTGELERSEQQLNEFVYREQITKRDLPNGTVALPDVERAYVEGTVAKVNEKLTTSPDIETGLYISQSQATAIGDDKFIVETVRVDGWPELKSSEWDPTLNTQVVRRQQFVDPPTSFTEENVSYQVVNEDRSLKITEEVPEDALESYLVSMPIRTDIQMPTVLKSAEIIWVKDEAETEGDSEGSGVAPAGNGYSIEARSTSTGSVTYSVIPSLKLEYENVFGSDIKATAYFFYAKSSNNSFSEGALISRLNSVAGVSAKEWPVFKPKAHTIVTQGARLTASADAAVTESKIVTLDGDEGSTESVKEEGSYSIDRTVDVTTINPTIHGTVPIANAGQYTSINVTASARARLTGAFDASASESYNVNCPVNVSPTSLPPTSPQDIPRSGNYIISSKAEPFKWGWVKCSAVVVDAAQFA